MLNSDFLDVSKLTDADLRRIMARGRALRAAETGGTLRRAMQLIRRIWI